MNAAAHCLLPMNDIVSTMGVIQMNDKCFCGAYRCFASAMIAWAGQLELSTGVSTRLEDCFVTQRFRTDDVHVGWRTD